MRLVPSTCVTVPIIGLCLILCVRTSARAAQDSSLTLTSPAFQNGGAIPERYTCSGRNESPELAWIGVPGRTRSFVLILDDPDAPIGTFTHWVAYNLSPTAKVLPEGMATLTAAGNGDQGLNGSGEIGYMGPCPPPGKLHHYHFRLYALDEKVDLKAGATAQQVEAVMKGHVLAQTELVGVFQR